MRVKPLGRTGLMVTELCLGTMTWGQQNSEAEGHAQIELALDHGINFIDTAEIYAIPTRPETQGATEAIIGTWFKKTGRRQDVILATKVAGGRTQPWIREGKRPDRASVRKAVEDSLSRLQTDYIDLYQVHWPSRSHYNFDYSWTFDPSGHDRADVAANLLDILEGLNDMVVAGKVRHVGVSNETSWGLMQYLRLAERHGLPRMASIQNEYSLIRRQFDLDLAEVAHHEDIALLAYSPLAAGALTGKYMHGAMPKGSRGDISGGIWRQSVYSEPVIGEYLSLAEKHGLDPAQMALAFCLTRPFMTSVIIGATIEEQLKTDIGSVDLKLSAEVLAEIEAIHRRYPRPI